MSAVVALGLGRMLPQLGLCDAEVSVTAALAFLGLLGAAEEHGACVSVSGIAFDMLHFLHGQKLAGSLAGDTLVSPGCGGYVCVDPGFLVGPG